MYFIDGQPFPISRLFAIDADGTNYKLLINRSRNAISQFQDRILDWRPRDPRHVSIELSPREMLSAYPEVFTLDIHTGAMTLEHKQRQPIAYWFADPQGVIRYGQGCDQFKRCEFVARESAAAPWRVLSHSKKYQDHDFSVLGFGPDDKLLITEQQEGRLAVFQFDLTDQNDKELVFAHPQFDVGGVTKWPTDGRITGFLPGRPAQAGILRCRSRGGSAARRQEPSGHHQ